MTIEPGFMLRTARKTSTFVNVACWNNPFNIDGT